MLRLFAGLPRRLMRIAQACELDRAGVAAVEFALILPLMLLIYLGSTELTQALMASRNATLVARTLADLLSQQESGVDVTDTTLSQVFTAATAVMAPFSTASLTMTITSVNMTPGAGGNSYNGYMAQPEWTVAASSPNAGPLRPCVNLTPVPDTTTPTSTNLPQDLYGNGSIIVADIAYTYTPAFGGNFFSLKSLPTSITYVHSAYMRPRSWTGPTNYIAYSPGTMATVCSSW